MIRFNIIGYGFLDMDASVGFKRQSPWYRFATVSMDRTVEFDVPASDHNRQLLAFGEDPSFDGAMLRERHATQMVYDGGVINGTLAVTAYEGDAFKCVFYFGADWVDKLLNLKLADCVCTLNNIIWATSTPVVDANLADWQQVELVKYDNGIGTQANWQLSPSVSVVAYLRDILTNLGVNIFNSGLPTELRMVAGTLNGRSDDNVTFSQTIDTGSVSQLLNLIGTMQADIKWATARQFGTYLGGGSTTATIFTADDDIKVTFGTIPTGVYLIKYDDKLGRCECLGGIDANGDGTDLSGKTVSFKMHDRFFFGDRPGNLVDYNLILYGGEYFGWKQLANPLSVNAVVTRDRDMVLGDTWRMQDNAPDMTVFEFIQSVCLATGLEYYVDMDSQTVRITRPVYGTKPWIKALTDVISVDSVRRNVSAWGDDCKTAVVDFDSEDYVNDRIEAPYTVDNTTIDGETRNTSRFSEGVQGAHGVRIEDVESDGNGGWKFKASKWTLAIVDSNASEPDYLQRIGTPDVVAYSDLAASSTCVKVKVAASEADFFDMTKELTWIWRGMAFVWTDADWQDGVMSMTLQKVSQQYVSPP